MLLRVKLVTLITLKILASSVVLIIMQDDATPTDTAPSQKRDTPEDAGTAQEPERRVRPRETPVGAPAAAAPEPEIQEDDADEAKDDEDGDTVAVPPAPPRTAVRYWRIVPGPATERAGWAGDPRNPFNKKRRGLKPRGHGPRPPRRPLPTQPDPWVREEFEVETGRVVNQETIEGEPPI